MSPSPQDCPAYDHTESSCSASRTEGRQAAPVVGQQLGLVVRFTVAGDQDLRGALEVSHVATLANLLGQVAHRVGAPPAQRHASPAVAVAVDDAVDTLQSH